MTASELIEKLKYAPGAKVFIAGYCDEPQEANSILFADEHNADGGLSFCDFGIALGEKAVLICVEDVEI